MIEMLNQLKDQFAVFGPNLLAGLVVLVLGWLVALVASYLVRKLLSKTTVDNKIARWMPKEEMESLVAQLSRENAVQLYAEYQCPGYRDGRGRVA